MLPSTLIFLHYVKYVFKKAEVVPSNGQGMGAFKRKYII